MRLTAEDGYQAQRSYSIASGPRTRSCELTVERLDDGEVSPYLADELQPGDELELRGPIGGLLRVGGAPRRARAADRRRLGDRAVSLDAAALGRPTGGGVPVRLLYSSRSLDEVIYRGELDQLSTRTEAEIVYTLTRAWPEDWSGHRGRIDAELLRRGRLAARTQAPLVFVCGPSGFVEAAADVLVARGHAPAAIRTERFGPTGT